MVSGAKKWSALLIALLAAFLAFAPLVLHRGAEFAGADEQAEKAINDLAPGYKPWAEPLWEPPSGEVESFLFALQAAAGSAFIGYFIGYYRGKKEGAGEKNQRGAEDYAEH